MKTFYTGDRVRLLHSHGQGVVMGRDAKGNVRVMLDDGFEIPVLDKDLALVHEQERRAMGGGAAVQVSTRKDDPRPNTKPTPSQSRAVQPPRESVSRVGLYLALTAPLAGSQDRELFLLNNTSLCWTGTIGLRHSGQFKIEAMFVAQPKQAVKMASLPGLVLQANPVAEFWALSAIPGGKDKPGALHTAWQINEAEQAKAVVDVPIFNRPAVLYQLDSKETRPDVPDTAALLSKWTNGGSEVRPSIAPPPREVDLHIETLSPNAASLSSDEILGIQTMAFTRALDAASATGAPDLILIHGVGNGTLRQTLHKHLSQRQDIEFYKDHMKERLGHGATLVKFRN